MSRGDERAHCDAVAMEAIGEKRIISFDNSLSDIIARERAAARDAALEEAAVMCDVAAAVHFKCGDMTRASAAETDASRIRGRALKAKL